MKLHYSAIVLAGLAAAVLTAGPARADARQDVVGGAQRCSALADDRIWLDCFYGSAQPLRTRLGLPPAPVNQQRLVPLQSFSAPVYAGARQDVMAGAQRCAAIADDRTWLDCFYGSAQPMRVRLGLAPAPINQQRLVPPFQGLPAPAYAAPTYPTYGVSGNRAPADQNASLLPKPPPLPKRHDSGMFSSVFGSSKAIVANVRMASWTKNKQDRFVVTLADGEIWQQDNGDNNSPNWRGAASRHVVNIYEGALGSYNLNVSDDSTLYKVHRIN